ncbi:succinylglutamate desuccinylase/aspartoacylase family protein [Granulosicoccus antarcticus]|uniref:N-alpha-acetyl-L-2,4-diaminobutyric acid deacetylase n=1 Tax=Granulosicoccus antarcticus IMCC3135 TaxID=1192854 RepID=A0A2Z2NYV6_9GAMM|nr:succinylglutamate desuccinylase/aspartoacylase family protein [Granulosicoccus antarcticus]ASJ76499.1 N-alpha-acetyl-L-2,4-diaminobutyric acid deacetylase [Granulosicoccus antarcticus IMCC3135]
MTQPQTPSPTNGLDLDLSDTHEPYAPSLLGAQDTHMTLDPAMPGKQHGHLILPYTNHAGAAQLRVPVCSIRGQQPGPTVVLIAGIHGDEYEGPLTLHRMAQELTAEMVHGCLLIVPAANGPGLKTGRRCLPDGTQDLDQCFPGSATGSLGDRLAYELFERLIRAADLVLDLRSGGQKLQFSPLAAVRFMGVSLHRSQERQQASEAAMIAFGAPNSVRFQASRAGSCLQAAVEAAGKAYVQSELGGGAGCSVGTLQVAEIGCLNVLSSMGVLKREVELRATRMLEVPDSSFYVYADRHGMLEPQARLGQEVWQGDVLLRLVELENSGSQAHEVAVPRNSILLALHHGGMVRPGDLLAILADEVQR